VVRDGAASSVGAAERGGVTPRVAEMRRADWEAVRRIYLEGIGTGNATFEQRVGGFEDWDRRFLPVCRLVARIGDTIAGWAALAPFSAREVYRGVADVSIYVGMAHTRRGVGRALLQALVTRSEAAGFWTLQAGVFPENVPSVQLHLACGFEPVGVRRRIGFLRGVWRDVLLLERRSRVVGT